MVHAGGGDRRRRDSSGSLFTLPSVLISCCVLAALGVPVAAQPAGALFTNQPLTAQQISRTTDPKTAAQFGEFSASLLEQYVLAEFSLWRLAGQGLEDGADLAVYEMLDSPAALGLYSLGLGKLGSDVRRLQWGLDAEAGTDRLIFWRGNFYFSVHLLKPGPLDSLREWVQRVAGRVEHPTVYPMTVVQLPEAGLVRDSIRFYLTDEALRGETAFPKALLGRIGFDNRAEVTAARYQPEGRILFLIGYPTASLAADRFSGLQEALQSVFSQDGIYLKRSGLLISLIEAPEEEARELLDRVRYTATVKWIYEKDTSLEDLQERRGQLVTFFGIISTSLLFTGLFIVLMLIGGIVVGVLRYRILERHPQLRAGDDMIRLDLDRVPSRPTTKN